MQTYKDNQAWREAAQARFAYRVAAALDESAENLPADVVHRLAQARTCAVQAQRSARLARGGLAQRAGALVAVSAGGPVDGAGWRARLGLLLALPTLLFGLYALQHFQQERFVHRIADIDTALLLDELPPQAYLDPGFRNYLRQGA